ncbi:MAG: hypothetical protein KBD06_00250 [Candidatus Pacebacteria bacterium]|nr:hypothetical protein [Candidatus Paceibacterota bacterium]
MPGNYTFTVPTYGSLTVTVNGAGGGGSSGRVEGLGVTIGTKMCGSVYLGNSCVFQAGSNGGSSRFGSGMVAYGGTGAPQGADWLYTWSIPASPGSPGGGSGGAITTGGGASGGIGGQGSTCNLSGAPMCGASGGAGGRVVTTYPVGALTPGSVLSVVVGSGGAGGVASGITIAAYAPPGGAGAPGSVTVSWTTIATPSCSINAAPTTINQPSGTSLTWVSANATTFYITGVGYVTANASNGATVYPSATITYTGTATGPGGTANCSRTVTVNRSCTLNGNTILHGASVTTYQASNVAYGNSCVSQTRTCTDGTLSGTYAYASCTVGTATNCTLDGVTVPHGTSKTFYTSQTAPVGQTCSSGTVSQTRTCTNGVLSGSASYQYASCSCAPTYSCSGNNVQYSNAACSTSTVATCTAPSYCSAGKSTCQYDAMTFTSFSATSTTGTSGNGSVFMASGHLQARPGLVRSRDSSRLYWNVRNAQSCTVTGTNGDVWTQTSSPSWGYATSPITEVTHFTLNCVAFPSVTPSTLRESASVLLAPDYNER